MDYMYCLLDLLYITKRYLHTSTALVWNTSIFLSNIFSSETAASFQFPKFRLLSSGSFCFQKESATLHWYWYTSMAIAFFLRIFLPVLSSQLGTIPSQIQPPASHTDVKKLDALSNAPSVPFSPKSKKNHDTSPTEQSSYWHHATAPLLQIQSTN